MKQIVVIITGLSGSGKSVALRALEDEGFFCADNLPVTLMESFVSTIATSDGTVKIGIGIDIREKEFLPSLGSVLGLLREKYHIEIIFLEAEKDALLRRFKETRRPHPLVSEEVSIEEAIRKESILLAPLRNEADRIIDTSSYTPHRLRHTIASFYKASDRDADMAITLISFGYKFGIPQNIDLLFDVRFIPNPHFVPALRDLNGRDSAVQDFVFCNTSSREFMEKASALLDFLIPQYIEEGKAYLTIGFGCTGGKHRSPAIVERVAQHIRMKTGMEPIIIHRDME
ncbi:MAG TPA: RNase adapter RapZ [Thermodesulfovibrionales bacterium]|nr:RNase adapter RapZ [Thermodesulfovibrionales bacterium]